MNPSIPLKKFYCDFQGDGYEVAIRVNNVADAGIGPYEFWGSRGNQSGLWYAEDWTIERVRYDNGEKVEDPERVIREMYDDPDFTCRAQEELDVWVGEWAEEQHAG